MRLGTHCVTVYAYRLCKVGPGCCFYADYLPSGSIRVAHSGSIWGWGLVSTATFAFSWYSTKFLILTITELAFAYFDVSALGAARLSKALR
jgi:hypothetical protein